MPKQSVLESDLVRVYWYNQGVTYSVLVDQALEEMTRNELGMAGYTHWSVRHNPVHHRDELPVVPNPS